MRTHPFLLRVSRSSPTTSVFCARVGTAFDPLPMTS